MQTTASVIALAPIIIHVHADSDSCQCSVLSKIPKKQLYQIVRMLLIPSNENKLFQED